MFSLFSAIWVAHTWMGGRCSKPCFFIDCTCRVGGDCGVRTCHLFNAHTDVLYLRCWIAQETRHMKMRGSVKCARHQLFDAFLRSAHRVFQCHGRKLRTNSPSSLFPSVGGDDGFVTYGVMNPTNIETDTQNPTREANLLLRERGTINLTVLRNRHKLTVLPTVLPIVHSP